MFADPKRLETRFLVGIEILAATRPFSRVMRIPEVVRIFRSHLRWMRLVLSDSDDALNPFTPCPHGELL